MTHAVAHPSATPEPDSQDLRGDLPRSGVDPELRARVGHAVKTAAG